VVELLRAAHADDVLSRSAGPFRLWTSPELKQLGVSEVFTPGAATQDIVEFLCSAIAQRGARRST
jgi:methylmalonyl-CoA mutase C-terminal domain/subunit